MSWQRELVVVEFVWHYLIARPRKPVIRKNFRDISHTSRVIADFVPNFVAMATGVGRGRICLARPRKPPVIRKHLRDISIPAFLLNLRPK